MRLTFFLRYGLIIVTLIATKYSEWGGRALKRRILSLIMIFCILISLTAAFTVGNAKASTLNKVIYSWENVLNLTFDGSEQYGISLTRSAIGYNVDYLTEGENGYMKLGVYRGGGGASVFFANSGSFGPDSVDGYAVQYSLKTYAQEVIDSAVSNSLLIEPGVIYRLSYSFKYFAGSYVSERCTLPVVAEDPTAGAPTSLEKLASIIEKDNDRIIWTDGEVSGEASVNDTVWQKATFVFYLPTEYVEDSMYLGISTGNGSSDTGNVMAIDNVLLQKESSVISDYSEVSYSFDDEPTLNSNGSTWEYVDTDRAGDNGKALKCNGAASVVYRASFTDTGIIEKNKKYYISFDAKTDIEGTDFGLTFGNAGNNNSGNRRFIFCSAENYTAVNSACRYYVDGVEVPSITKFKPSLEWKRYGIVVDTSNKTFLTAISRYQSDFCENVTYLLIGGYNSSSASTVWYDNLKIVGLNEHSGVLPEDLQSLSSESSVRTPRLTENGEYITAGLRFKAEVPSDIKEAASEIGFLVAPSSYALTNAQWYTEAGEPQSASQKAVCFVDGEFDYLYSGGDTENSFYQVVLTGMSDQNGNVAYSRRFGVILYIKSKTDGSYTYYNVGECSYYQTNAMYDIIENRSSMSINGVLVNNFSIVHNFEGRSWLIQEELRKLNTAVRNATGGQLKVSEDTDTAVGTYEISIGDTDRAVKFQSDYALDEYEIIISGSKVYVLGGSSYAVQVGITELCELLKKGDVTDADSKTGRYSDAVTAYDNTSYYKLTWSEEFNDSSALVYNDGENATLKNWYLDPLTVNGNTVSSTDTSRYFGDSYLVSDCDTVEMRDGMIILRAIKNDNSTVNYAATTENGGGNEGLLYKHQGGLRSENNMYFNFGYLEMRARVPDGTGVYSSFWLDCRNKCNLEIDIFESLGVEHQQRANIHWWNSVANGGHTWISSSVACEYNHEGGSLFDDWHIVGLLWNSREIKFIYDGEVFYEQTTGMKYFGKYLQVVAGVNVGWANRTQPASEDLIPLEYQIDYFRLYQIDGQGLEIFY